MKLLASILAFTITASTFSMHNSLRSLARFSIGERARMITQSRRAFSSWSPCGRYVVSGDKLYEINPEAGKIRFCCTIDSDRYIPVTTQSDPRNEMIQELKKLNKNMERLFEKIEFIQRHPWGIDTTTPDDVV